MMETAVSPSFLKRLKRTITHSKWFLSMISFIAARLIKLYGKTLTIKVVKPESILNNPNQQFIAGFWHGHQFLIIQVAYLYKTAVMTDISWAGELQTRILSRLGLKPVRGSSKRKGASALICMRKAIQEGHTAAFALDGPSGPKYKAKPGIVYLSQKLNLPIVPFVVTADRKWVLTNTWCDYILPKPFAKCSVFLGEPIIESMNEDYNEEKLNQHMQAFIKQCEDN